MAMMSRVSLQRRHRAATFDGHETSRPSNGLWHSGSKWHTGRHESVSEMVWRFAGANGCVDREGACHAKDGGLSGTDICQIGCFAICDLRNAFGSKHACRRPRMPMPDQTSGMNTSSPTYQRTHERAARRTTPRVLVNIDASARDSMDSRVHAVGT